MIEDNEMEKILNKCVEEVYENWIRVISDLERSVYKFKEMGTKIANLKEPYHASATRNRVYLKKVRDDPFDLLYVAGVRLRFSSLKETVDTCFKKRDIDFDFEEHQNEIYSSLEKCLSKKTNLKISVKKVTGHIHVDALIMLDTPSYVTEL